MGRRNIDEKQPEDAEQKEGRKLQAIRHGARDQGAGDHGERHLIDGEQQLRNCRGERADGLHADSRKERTPELPDPAAFAVEAERVGEGEPENRDQRRCGEALRHRGEHVLLSDHAGVEHGQPGNGHHQNERGGCDHEAGIGSADRGGVCGEGGGRRGKPYERYCGAHATRHFLHVPRFQSAVTKHGDQKGIFVTEASGVLLKYYAQCPINGLSETPCLVRQHDRNAVANGVG